MRHLIFGKEEMKVDDSKIGRYYRLSERTLEQLGELKKRSGENYKNNTAIIEYAIKQLYEKEHSQHELLITDIDELVDLKFKEQLLPYLNRLVVIGNVLDRNIQMQMEFWNHYFIMTDAKQLGSTEKLKTKPFEEGEALIKERIGHNRQKKIDRDNKRINNETS